MGAPKQSDGWDDVEADLCGNDDDDADDDATSTEQLARAIDGGEESEPDTPKASSSSFVRLPHKRRGTPATGSIFDWEKVEASFVYGRTILDPSGVRRRIYPTVRSIAGELGCSEGLVSHHVVSGDWKRKREEAIFAAGRDEAASLASKVFAPKDVENPSNENPRREGRRSPLETINAYIELFDAALDSGRLRPDAMSDFDRAVRLKAHLETEAARIDRKTGPLSLDQIAERHARQRKLAFEAATDAVAGVVSSAEAEADADRAMIPDAKTVAKHGPTPKKKRKPAPPPPPPPVTTGRKRGRPKGSKNKPKPHVTHQ